MMLWPAYRGNLACRCDTMSHSQAGCEGLVFHSGFTCQWQLRYSPSLLKQSLYGGISTLPPSISLIDIPPLLTSWFLPRSVPNGACTRRRRVYWFHDCHGNTRKDTELFPVRLFFCLSCFSLASVAGILSQCHFGQLLFPDLPDRIRLLIPDASTSVSQCLRDNVIQTARPSVSLRPQYQFLQQNQVRQVDSVIR
jgi:hypothetical protein